MTLETIAANAANALSRRIIESTAAAEQRQRLARIINRWNLEWLRDRAGYFPSDEVVRINGRAVHMEDTYHCEGCESPCLGTTSVHTRSRAGRLTTVDYCDDCRDDRGVSSCYGCHEASEENLMVERDGDMYCDSCADDLPSDDEIPCYHGAERWAVPVGPSYSFELEVEATDRDGMVDALKAANFEKVSWEMDGSLSHSEGLEILIQHRPSTGALANSTIELVRAIKGRGFGVRSWEGNKCGMHLNSNRSGWSKHSVMRLTYLVQVCKEQLIKISGRDSTHWAPFGYGGFTLRELAEGTGGKYKALRIGWDRFEWRMFRGTLNERRIRLYCATVHALETLAQSDIQAHHLRAEAVSALRTLCCNLNFPL